MTSTDCKSCPCLLLVAELTRGMKIEKGADMQMPAADKDALTDGARHDIIH